MDEERQPDLTLATYHQSRILTAIQVGVVLALGAGVIVAGLVGAGVLSF